MDAIATTDGLKRERYIVLLVGAIQFVNVLDFMMVMPLGPDFARELGIAESRIGIVGGSYTLAAGIAGLVGSVFLDRFDRRRALAVTMLGLVLGTALGGLATGIVSLLLARVVAGAFGGPATSLSLAVIADSVPAARRGKALGTVMASFSVASVLGVPAGLELSRRFGFRAPFFAVAALGLLLAALAIRAMPEMRGHLAKAPGALPPPRVPLSSPLPVLSLSITGLVMLGIFAVVPNISAFVQFNLGYPRDRIGLLYLVGGLASFACMRIVGRLVDRVGAARMVGVGTLLHVAALLGAFIFHVPWAPVLLVFTLYMLSSSSRMVPLQTLASRVPLPEQRARFMSAQSAVQHFASAFGAMLASLHLVSRPSGALSGMVGVAWVALALACLVPFGAALLERKLRERDLPLAV